jgi:hypothetical protein
MAERTIYSHKVVLNFLGKLNTCKEIRQEFTVYSGKYVRNATIIVITVLWIHSPVQLVQPYASPFPLGLP